MPIALGRPDRADLGNAAKFGEKVREKLSRISTLDSLPPIHVPGNFPYKALDLASGITPITDAAKCCGCGECISVCPVGAISAADPSQVHPERCIRCCACVKFCPTGAKAMDHARINQFREFLTLNHKAPKNPETYL
jgi:ferredoxin